MNYYPHNIGDFDKATRHLTRIERSIYRDMIELYYDIEKQLPLDIPWICRKIIANEESTLVEQTLNEFFTKTPTGWYHDRCELEIEHFRSSNTQKALAGKASAAARALKKQQALNARSTSDATNDGTGVGAGVEQTCNGTPTKQEPITNNQEPIKKKSRASAPPDDPVPKPDGVDQQTWDDLLKVRKGKKAAVTQTMVNSAINEAAKANLTLEQFFQIWCRRGSQSLEAEWLKPHELRQFSQAQQPNQSKYAGAASVLYGNSNQRDFIDA